LDNAKLNYKKTIFVGLAFFGITMFWQTYDSLIAKILIDKFGLTQFWSGAVMALDNVLALLLLPLFGLLSDKTKSRFGKRTPYIIIGTVLAALSFMSLSFVDNRQTMVMENEGIVAKYEDKYESILSKQDVTRAEWELIFIEIGDPEITADFHEVITVNGSLISLNDELTEFQHRDVSDVYYNYLNQEAWAVTKNDPGNLILFLGVLFVVLLSMSVYRTPAVALMPDVTLKPLRSKANAVINLLGSAGAVTAILVMTVTGVNNKSYVNYTPAFITIGILMLVALLIFLITVNENKLNEQYELEVTKYGLEEEVEDIVDSNGKLPKDKLVSLILILSSVFLWFMGYNAVISKLSDYAPKVLQMNYTLPLLVAQGAAIVSFIPIGILSSRFGRKKMILVGVTLLTICFGSAFFLTQSTGFLLYVVLAFTGIAWATINVNSFPMVVELATGSNVGKYTGYYYTFSMAAQIVTPMLSGLFMDEIGRTALFPYAALFVALSFVTMFFVKHGDAQVVKRGILESFDVED